MDENMFNTGLDVATISAELPNPVITLSGADSYTVQDTADYPLLALSVYGKSVQDGTPTPDVPIDIVNVGDNGTVEVTACGKNLLASAIKETQTKNGITVEAYGDGSYRATGTATADTRIAFQLPKPIVTPNELIYISTNNSVAYEANMAVSFLSNTTSIATIYLREINQKAARDKLIGQTITHIAFNFVSGVTVDVTVKPQLETKQYSEFDPYKGNTATITSGLPLRSAGDVRDELVYNADGTGKIIKRIAMITLDGSDDEEYSTGATTNIYMGFSTKNLPLPVKLTTAIKSNRTDKVNKEQATTDSFAIHCGSAVNLLFGVDMNVTTIEEVRSWLATHPTTIIYPLAEPQEIELSAVEMAELQKLQTFDGMTNIYNDEGAEMLVKALRREFDMRYVEWLKESQTWACPKAGKWKVICVGGGASGGLYDSTENAVKLTPTTAGGTTSFGSIVSADGAPSTKDGTVRGYGTIHSAVSGYGGYTGTSYGGVPMVGGNSATSDLAVGGTGNAAVMAFSNPTAAVGYGAGGGAVSLKEEISPIAGRAGSIESTIVGLEEGQTIMCTVGKGGQTTDPATMGSGADGVIVVQYLGY